MLILGKLGCIIIGFCGGLMSVLFVLIEFEGLLVLKVCFVGFGRL